MAHEKCEDVIIVAEKQKRMETDVQEIKTELSKVQLSNESIGKSLVILTTLEQEHREDEKRRDEVMQKMANTMNDIGQTLITLSLQYNNIEKQQCKTDEKVSEIEHATGEQVKALDAKIDKEISKNVVDKRDVRKQWFTVIMTALCGTAVGGLVTWILTQVLPKIPH